MLALAATVAEAQSPETLTWLRKINEATQKLSYTGTFVYQNGARSETSRITRYVDPSTDIERLEVIDGMPREIVRTRDTVRCYLPGLRLVKVDRRTERDSPRFFPNA
jgi:sigma-E factor negative regulatory protein RseB